MNKDLCAALTALLWCVTGSAAPGFVKGQVEFVRTHDASNANWAPPRFWFSLKGVTQAGTCGRWASGTVLFVAEDKQALSIVLAAQASGQEIAVAFDDTRTTNGWCAAGYLTIGNPAPAY